MIEIKHIGPVRSVDAQELENLTRGGLWHIIASYSEQQRVCVESGGYSYETRNHEPPKYETLSVQCFLVAQNEETALSSLGSKLEKVEDENGRLSDEVALLKSCNATLETALKEKEALLQDAIAGMKRDAENHRAQYDATRRGERALVDASKALRILRAEISEARARELLGENQ